jgi:hypothetical protein
MVKKQTSLITRNHVEVIKPPGSRRAKTGVTEQAHQAGAWGRHKFKDGTFYNSAPLNILVRLCWNFVFLIFVKF